MVFSEKCLGIFSESVTSRSGKKNTIENAVSSADIVFFFFKMSVTFYQNLVTIREKYVRSVGRSALVAESPVYLEETFALASLGNKIKIRLR